MEQGRLLIAIVLSFLVFLLWQFFFVDKEAVQKAKQAPQITQEQVTKETPYIDKTGKIDTSPLITGDLLQPSQTARIITVNSPFYSAQISEKGAVINSFVLKDYREKVEEDSPLKEMVSADIHNGMFRTEFAGNSLPGLNDAVFLTDIKSDSVDVFDKSQKISFSWVTSQGIVVEKTYSFSPETYLIGLTVNIKNGSNHEIKDNMILSLMGPSHEKNIRYGFVGPSALINDKLEQVKIKKIEDKNVYAGELKWIALQEQYFMSGIIPKKPVEASMRIFMKQNDILENQFMLPAHTIKPGTQQSFDFDLFLGPMSMKVLSKFDNDLDKAINFGMFDIIAKPCLWLMNFLYSFIPNYGLAIIILTLITKVILWPLGSKSYKSMSEMKKIQPLMAEIREKYKNDKKKMNEELMGLYRVYKINPMGGCLPMILQIPVFFALYRMLYEAIELRHAPFLLWINDLSAPDRLFRFDFTIPFMQPPYGIPVLTIIMGATMFLQQKMSPPPGDPGQAKMMMFMPIIFTAIFINFSSGLVLYWLVNNILSIAQQYYISKKTA